MSTISNAAARRTPVRQPVPGNASTHVALRIPALDEFAVGDDLDVMQGVTGTAALDALIANGLDHIPLAGGGKTLERWRKLSQVAARDLSVGRLFEGHTDALAILAELNSSPRRARESWGVWAAETGTARVQMVPDGLRMVRLHGTKRWCPGAEGLTHALVAAWLDGAGPYLVRVALEQSGVTTRDGAGHHAGADRPGIEVDFDNAKGRVVRGLGDYLERPGFWHGGIGEAACWHGAAIGLTRQALEHVSGRLTSPQSALIGRMDIALHDGAHALRDAATSIDADPHTDARELALRTRSTVARSALDVRNMAWQVLGGSDYGLSPQLARMAADLPEFVRQKPLPGEV